MKIIGHRGARGLAPGNTLPSFKKALEFKVDEIEIDVRVSKDNVPVVYHDKNLIDASGNRLTIAKSSYSELKEHSPTLLTLTELLDFIKGRVPLYIEVKWGVDVEPIVKELKNYRHKFYLASKSQKTLKQLHAAMPKVPKIVIEPMSGVRASRRARELNTKLISMNKTWLWFGFISAMNRSGYELYAYTLNNPVKAKSWAKHGLVGAVTDYPDRFQKN